LDPEGAFDDASVWAALESVHMKDAIETLPNKLHSIVVESMFKRGKSEKKRVRREIKKGKKRKEN
jgi:hypothetical protein